MPSPVESAIRGVVTQAVTKVAQFNRTHKRAEGPNPFLEGVHQPLAAERSFTDLQVQGQIPAELDGTYLRNGPNPVAPPNPATYHWFVGEGMLHGVRLKGGKALWYRNRWVRGEAAAKAVGEPVAPGPRTSGFDAPNTNVIGHAGATWAIVEAGGFPARIDGELNTIAHDPFGGTLKNAFSAHPHLDPATGELHAITYKATVPETLWHVVVTADGRVRREEPIPVQHGPSVHDCMLTERYVIVLDLPVTFSMKAFVAGQAFPYRWNPEHPARVGLLPREGKAEDIVWCTVEPSYIFHAVNAYERADGVVVLDACVHDTMFIGNVAGPESERTPLERWLIDPAARRVQREVLDPDPQEFPRPNEALTGKPYRFAYAVGLQPQSSAARFDAQRLYKHDVEARRREVHDFGAGRVVGEFVFVARAGSTAEDDGWLMGYVVDPAHEATELVILDAQRFEAEPVARIRIPQRIPPGFHGNWIPAV